MDTWIFAYGSLLWDPGFEPVEAFRATLTGWRRSLCLWSIHWRGTPEVPGLVLALDAESGAACEGLALRVARGGEGPVLAALRARELVSDAYEERTLPVRLHDGRDVAALAYVIRRGHAQHARLDLEAQARVVASARGARGPNLDYVESTAAHLAAAGMADAGLDAVLARARALAPQARIGLGSRGRPDGGEATPLFPPLAPSRTPP